MISSLSETGSKRLTKQEHWVCLNEQACVYVLDYQVDPTVDKLQHLCDLLDDYVEIVSRRLKKQYRKIDFEDIRSEASIGLISAASRFDLTKGKGFLKYFELCACGRLRHYHRDYTRLIRIPGYLQLTTPMTEWPFTVSINTMLDDGDTEGDNLLEQRSVEQWIEANHEAPLDSELWGVVEQAIVAAEQGCSPKQLSELLQLHKGLPFAKKVLAHLKAYVHREGEYADLSYTQR